jgi:hypothetical protein
MTRRNFTERLRNSRRSDGAGGADTLADDLDRLRKSETGVGYVYFALDLLASRYALSDVHVVIDLGTLGSQVFRLGGKTTFPGRDEVRNSPRGLYCQPPVVPEDDARIFYEACALELTNPRPLQPGIDKLYSTGSFQSRATTRTPADPSGVPDDDWFISGSTGDRWNVGQHENAPQVRRRFTQFLVAVDVANLVMAFANTHGPVRFFLGLLFGVLVPGWSIIGFLKLKNAALEISLSIATSLALIMVCAQIMITLKLWHLVSFQEILSIACLVPLLRQSTRAWMNRLVQ